MIIMKIIINIFSAVIQLLTISVFFNIYGVKRDLPRYLGIIFKILFLIISVLSIQFIEIQLMFTIVIMCSITLYSLLYRMSILKRGMCIAIICILLIISEILFGTLYCVIYNITIEDTQNNLLIYMQIVVLSKLSLYVVFKTGNYYINRQKDSLSNKSVYALIILPITSFVVLYALSQNVYVNDNLWVKFTVFIAAIMLIASNLLVYGIFDFMIKQKHKERELEFQAMKLENEKQYYEDLSERTLLSNKTLHDVKNKIFAIKSYMETDINKAHENIDSIFEIAVKSRTLKITGIVALDNLLNHKKANAKAIGAEMKIVILSSKIKDYNVIDLCIIFGNLIDNAIEACAKIDNKKDKCIDIEIKQNNNYLSISIINDVEQGIIPNSNIRTTKKNKLIHGFGLSNVKEIVNKYNGIMRYNIKNDKFIINVFIESI